MMIEGSGSGSIPLTSGSGSGSWRPKNTWIRWIRIRNQIRIRNTAFLACQGEAHQKGASNLKGVKINGARITMRCKAMRTEQEKKEVIPCERRRHAVSERYTYTVRCRQSRYGHSRKCRQAEGETKRPQARIELISPKTVRGELQYVGFYFYLANVKTWKVIFLLNGFHILTFHQGICTANNFGLMCSRKRISQNSFPNLIYIIPKSFMVFCQELHNPKRNYENQI
jgi:hypothetical protein